MQGSHFAELSGPYSPTSVPIYQTATFSSPSSLSTGLFDYTRSNNPTRSALQLQLAAVEQAAHAFVFTTGMAALSLVTQLLSSGQAVLCGDDTYGGTVRLLCRVLDPASHPVHFCDLTDLLAVERRLRQSPNIRLVLVRRSPSHRPRRLRPPARRLIRSLLSALPCAPRRLRAPPTL